MPIKLFGTRLSRYSVHTPKSRPKRYGEYMCKMSLDKTEQTPKQIRNDKIFSSRIMRIKDWLGIGC